MLFKYYFCYVSITIVGHCWPLDFILFFILVIFRLQRWFKVRAFGIL